MNSVSQNCHLFLDIDLEVAVKGNRFAATEWIQKESKHLAGGTGSGGWMRFTSLWGQGSHRWHERTGFFEEVREKPLSCSGQRQVLYLNLQSICLPPGWLKNMRVCIVVSCFEATLK